MRADGISWGVSHVQNVTSMKNTVNSLRGEVKSIGGVKEDDSPTLEITRQSTILMCDTYRIQCHRTLNV